MGGDWLGPLMFGVVFLLIFSGYPVAFALGGTSLMFAFLGIAEGYFDLPFLLAFPERVFGVMSNQVLLAVPFFIFMGTMLERSKLAEDLLRTVGLIFGPMRGGLALAVVFVGVLLAAATGVVGASVVAMGMISLPIMTRYGYAPSLSTGVICASGTLGQIVPPSVVLVVLGDQLGISVGDLFVGALIPGLMLAGLFALYVATIAWLRPHLAPAIPIEERRADPGAERGRLLLPAVVGLVIGAGTFLFGVGAPVAVAAGLAGAALLVALPGHLQVQVLKVLLPPLVLILIVLGSIFAGVASPTEAGALGAVGACLLAVVGGRFSLANLRGTTRETMRLTTMVVFLLIGSTAFALVFRGVYGDVWIEDLLTGLPGGIVGLLIVANLTIFLLGFFIDFFEIAFIILPLIAPAARALGLESDEMVWFGVMIAMNMQTSFLTPPFGFSLFYLRGVAPKEIPTSAIYRGAIPFIAIQLLALTLVIVFPELVTGLLGDRG